MSEVTLSSKETPSKVIKVTNAEALDKFVNAIQKDGVVEGKVTAFEKGYITVITESGTLSIRFEAHKLAKVVIGQDASYSVLDKTLSVSGEGGGETTKPAAAGKPTRAPGLGCTASPHSMSL